MRFSYHCLFVRGVRRGKFRRRRSSTGWRRRCKNIRCVSIQFAKVALQKSNATTCANMKNDLMIVIACKRVRVSYMRMCACVCSCVCVCGAGVRLSEESVYPHRCVHANNSRKQFTQTIHANNSRKWLTSCQPIIGIYRCSSLRMNVSFCIESIALGVASRHSAGPRRRWHAAAAGKENGTFCAIYI